MSAQTGTSVQQQTVTPRHKHKSGKYIVGYLLSLVLTGISFSLALTHSMSFQPLIVVLVILAAFQIVVQLFFFMHVTESDGPAYHAMGLVLGLFFTFAIAFMSVWIMGFNSIVS
ncbi:cytochrome o ubiquinol/quinol oxidase subunit IV [Alicyclobacillus sp. SO9]|uniref:cytochrome o ubiquinol oxidase subunit IV n=1 Tax=Alicyclobacillus sp. SO9 TaxID=2665646 RepID=UPI0018E73E3E|nr:cytochrome C oxidase subunit IV family protein [Alicyclobacillus sp. SO9]QQE77804.1 cytochrome C oxidase subunit IV family protein [Alicyclobacillus sp. SO9]